MVFIIAFYVSIECASEFWCKGKLLCKGCCYSKAGVADPTMAKIRFV